MILA
ncbi:bacterial regulatory helix-turn-helix s, AraC family protein, partial [Vibrio parahaemolyticus EKP-028]|jgi:hypothetical protein